MKTFNRVYDWDGNILNETVAEYEGTVTLCAGGGGGGDTTTTSEPWETQGWHLQRLYQRARLQSEEQTPMYPDQTYAGLTPNQTGGMYGGLDYMQGTFAPQAQRYVGDLQGMINAPMDVTTNPAVQAMVEANKSQITDTLTGEWLPAVRRASQAAGDYGGTKTDQITGQAVGDAAEALARANAQTYGGAYTDAMKQASYAASAMPAAMQLGMTPYEYQQQVGGVEQQYDQKAIDEAMRRYYYDDLAELQRLRDYSAIVQPGFGSYGQTTQDVASGSPAAGILGGAAAGAGIGASIPGPWTPYTTAGGAVIGGILGGIYS